MQQQQQQQLYFLTLNIQISHHLQIARLIEAGGVWTAYLSFIGMSLASFQIILSSLCVKYIFLALWKRWIRREYYVR